MKPEKLAPFCAPAALASATGATRLEAAEEILRVTPRRIRNGMVSIDAIARALGLPVYSVRLAPDDQGAGRGGWARGVVDLCPTLARWLRDHPGRSAIVRASSHFVHVDAGRVVEHNGWEPRRGRVTHVIWLDTPPPPRR